MKITATAVLTKSVAARVARLLGDIVVRVEAEIGAEKGGGRKGDGAVHTICYYSSRDAGFFFLPMDLAIFVLNLLLFAFASLAFM